MNRTRRIISEWMLQSGLVGDELLLEALLRRGFLAYRDDQGVWLATGSHAEDLDVLRLVAGLKVEPISGHKDRMALVRLKSNRIRAMNVAVRIVAIPENRSFNTTDDIPPHNGYSWGSTWLAYRNMVWGNKVATCPMRKIRSEPLGYATLDLGVALLVKALPLARVATDSYSCDGHGDGPATIGFHFEWDWPWAEAVFDVLGDATPNSKWCGGGASIAPLRGFGDTEVLSMLNDIQHFARRLLNQDTIDKIGRARARTLEAFGESPPNTGRFAQEARHQLAEEFAVVVRPST